MFTITYTDKDIPVHIGGSFLKIGEFVPERTIIITDENVKRLYGHLMEAYPTIVLPAGEDQKSLAVVENLVHQLVSLGADRGSFLLGVGGGVICDITGFVASVFMRGIPFAFAPTTLLAQVDASIGGKNGVNSGPYKNMIGVFNQPQFILIDTGFLSSLSDEEYANGLAEVIKHCAIHNAKEFGWLVSYMDRILQRDPEYVERTVFQSVSIKTQIVDSDPLEKGDRRLLNFGHTYGHAIEKHYGIAHGRAVSLGMVLANRMAVERGLLEEKKERYIRELLADAGLPTDVSDLDMKALNTLIRGDKKKVGDKVAFILLKDIGEPIIELIPLHD